MKQKALEIYHWATLNVNRFALFYLAVTFWICLVTFPGADTTNKEWASLGCLAVLSWGLGVMISAHRDDAGNYTLLFKANRVLDWFIAAILVYILIRIPGIIFGWFF